MPVNVETISFAINQPNQPDTQARQIHFEFMSNFYSYSPLISLELFKVHKSFNLNLIGKEEASCLCKPIYIYTSWGKNIDTQVVYLKLNYDVF